MLEPYEGKLSRTVLRGGGGSNTADLPDQVIENKQKFIGQIMTSKSPVRTCEDIDEAALSYAEVKALATGNPYIKEKMSLDIDVSKLKLLKANHTSQKYRMEDNITQHYPKQIAQLREQENGFEADIRLYEQNRFPDKKSFSMQIGNRIYTEKKEAGAALIEMCKHIKAQAEQVVIGAYQGFAVALHYRFLASKFVATLKGKMGHEVELGADALGNIQRLNNALDAMPAQLAEIKQKRVNVEHQLETAKIEVEKPFPKEAELKEKQERLNALNSLLNMNEKDFSTLGADGAETENYELQDTGNKMIVAEDVVYGFRQKTERLFHAIDGQNAGEIEQIVWDYIDSKTQENALDVQIEDVVLTGSRSRGLEQSGSDLEIVVEYKGSEREDNFFDVLHEDNLTIGGIPVDINPIKEGKSGTLQTYLPQAEQYLDQKQKTQEKPKRISIKEKLKGKQAEVQNRESQHLKSKEIENKKIDRNVSL